MKSNWETHPSKAKKAEIALPFNYYFKNLNPNTGFGIKSG